MWFRDFVSGAELLKRYVVAKRQGRVPEAGASDTLRIVPHQGSRHEPDFGHFPNVRGRADGTMCVDLVRSSSSTRRPTTAPRAGEFTMSFQARSVVLVLCSLTACCAVARGEDNKPYSGP